MRRMIGTAFVLGILMASASPAKAQFGLAIGNPYRGGVSIGNTGYGYPGAYPYTGYGYAPLNYGYNSGYAGYAPRVYAPRVYSYPTVRTYGYRNYGYGRRGWGGGYRRW